MASLVGPSGVMVFFMDSARDTARSSVPRIQSGRMASWNESVAAAGAKKAEGASMDAGGLSNLATLLKC